MSPHQNARARKTELVCPAHCGLPRMMSGPKQGLSADLLENKHNDKGGSQGGLPKGNDICWGERQILEKGVAEERRQRKLGEVAAEITSECWASDFWMIAKPWQKANEVRKSTHTWRSAEHRRDSPLSVPAARPPWKRPPPGKADGRGALLKGALSWPQPLQWGPPQTLVCAGCLPPSRILGFSPLLKAN